MTAREEATEVLKQITDVLLSGGFDLKLLLRRGQHACELLDWSDQRDWFRKELQGYQPDVEVPGYRKIVGTTLWRRQRSLNETIHDVVREQSGRYDRKDNDADAVDLDVRGDYDFIAYGAQHGYSEPTDETRTEWSDYLKKDDTAVKVKSFPQAQFQLILSAVERAVFDFASQSYKVLRYGEVVKDVWTDLQLNVETALKRAGLGDHLGAIDSGLSSDNPEAWRAAMIGCRTLVDDVANYLWRDDRSTYEYLPGSGDVGRLDVSQGKSLNRISAYLHQNGLSGTRGGFERAEIDRLDTSFRKLREWQSSGHDPVTKEAARTVALNTYVVLGELASRTSFEPVTEYRQPES